MQKDKEKDDARSALLAKRALWKPRPHQLPPTHNLWKTWLLCAGRGAGKTETCAHYVNEQAEDFPGLRIAIIAPTLGDAVEACVNGSSGLRKFNDALRVHNGPGGLHVFWPNGSEAKLFGAHTPEDVDRLRAGGNRHLAWAEELAAWRHIDDAWANMLMGLRLEPWPRVVASTTPRNLKLIKQLRDDALSSENTRTVFSTARTIDNPYLDESTVQQLLEMYGGSRVGMQELEGIILEDVAGALWKSEWIDANRIRCATPEATYKTRMKMRDEMKRIVIAVDPAMTAKKKTLKESEKESDDTGFCVAGLGHDDKYYVLDCFGMKATPKEWAERVDREYVKWKADKVIVEVNQGGDLVASNLRQVNRDLPIKQIHAYKGKTLRAEPIATMYEQGKVVHVGVFKEAEDQMVVFPVETDSHDDMVDALVYAITELTGRGTFGLRFL
jgi:predicted phage terminase large subunit-like protein